MVVGLHYVRPFHRFLLRSSPLPTIPISFLPPVVGTTVFSLLQKRPYFHTVPRITRLFCHEPPNQAITIPRFCDIRSLANRRLRNCYQLGDIGRRVGNISLAAPLFLFLVWFPDGVFVVLVPILLTLRIFPNCSLQLQTSTSDLRINFFLSCLIPCSEFLLQRILRKIGFKNIILWELPLLQGSWDGPSILVGDDD